MISVVDIAPRIDATGVHIYVRPCRVFHLVVALTRIPVKMTASAVKGLEFRVDADPRLDGHLETSGIVGRLAPLVLEGRGRSKMLDAQFIRLGGRIDRKPIIR